MTNAWIDWFLTFIIHVNTSSIVMWVIPRNNADWDCFKTLILREILRIQNPLLEEHCAFSEVIHFFEQIGCVRNKLQLHTVQQNPKSSLWTLDWDWTGFPLSICGIWLFVSLEIQFRLLIDRGNPLWTVTKITDQTNYLKEWSLNNIDCVPSNVQFSHQETLLCVFEDNEAVIKMNIKGRRSHNETCFQDPQSCAWLVVWSNQFGPQNPNHVHRHQKPTRRHANQREISHVTNGIICCVCSISAISVLQFVLKPWQKDYNKIQEKNQSQRTRDQWWPLLQGCLRIYHRRLQKARGRKAMEIRISGVRKLRKRIERGNPLWAATQEPRMSMIMKNLLKALWKADTSVVLY